MRTRWLCLMLSALLGSASLTAHPDSPAPPLDAEPRFAVPPPPMGGEAPASLVRRTPPPARTCAAARAITAVTPRQLPLPPRAPGRCFASDFDPPPVLQGEARLLRTRIESLSDCANGAPTDELI
jgi:hypothetical protein